MNKRSFRLIFDRERGMLVATGEHVATQGKSAQGTTRARRRAALALAASAAMAAQLAPPDAMALSFPTGANAAPALPRSAALAANRFGSAATKGYNNLPQPNPLTGNQPFVQLGGVTLRDANGNPIPLGTAISDSVRRLVIDQGSNAKVILNWKSFDIGLGYGVEFVQPTGGSALNYIRGADPSLILGSLKANGEVILQNGNGIIFGPNARVDTGRFIATSLNLAQSVYEKGLRSYTDGSAIFNQGTSDLDAGIRIERGAEIRAAAGGDVLIFAPRVVNEGRIETPDGQTALAAGNQVYLMSSSDQTQRGLVVAVNAPANGRGLYTVEQGEAKEYKTVDGETVDDSTPDNTTGLVKKVNAIVAERGSINLVGLAIKQNGLLQATTAVKGKNGVIQLVAQQSAGNTAKSSADTILPVSQLMGQVTFGRGSRTEVLPSDDGATQLDAESTTYKNNVSKILVDASQIEVQSGATLKANAGLIRMRAADNTLNSKIFNANANSAVADTSRVVIESGAVLDVSGLKDVLLPMSRNQISGKLFAIELADTPVQRNGVLYRQEIFFDGRSGVKVGNASGFYNSIGRTARELATKGGTLSVQAEGAVVADSGARLDISGGSLQYTAGSIRNSLVRLGKVWIPITQADPNVRYDELYTPADGTPVPGYVEGKAAGSATIDARKVAFDATVDGSVKVGAYQAGRTSGVSTPSAGSLTFGGTYLGGIRVVNGAATRPSAFLADPDRAGLSLLDNVLTLSADKLSAAQLGSLGLNATSNITLDQGSSLTLANGGTFKAHAFGGDVTALGDITAHSGSIQLAAVRGANGSSGRLTLGSQARLDASGTWTDDRASNLFGTPGAARVSVQGGTVSLSATDGLTTQAGSGIDVSAGGWRPGSGSDTKGKAGKVSLSTNYNGTKGEYVDTGSALSLNGTLSGYDFSAGGTLEILGLPGLTLDAAGPYASGFFNDHGFGTFTLKSLGDVTIASSFNADLRLKNYVAVRSAIGTQRFATVQTVPDATKRAAVSVTLGAGEGALTGSLTMQAGSRLATEAGGSLTLNAKRNLTVAGELTAPGGTINLQNTSGIRGNRDASDTTDQVGFYKDQAIWLTSAAKLSVAGTAEVNEDRLGRRTGTVYGGGAINLNADHGYIVAEAGSRLDLSGYADTLYQSSTGASQLVSRSAGSLSLSTPEGFVLESIIDAKAPNQYADGGKFSAGVTLNNVKGAGNIYGTAGRDYPGNPREIRVLVDTDRSPSLAGLGQAGTSRDLLAVLGNGVGELSAKRLEAAGFSTIALKADDKITLGLTSQQSLKATKAIYLDTPVLAALAGSDNRLSASYVAMGNQTLSNFTPKDYQKTGGVYSPQSSTDGNAAVSTRLAIEAGLIEVYGLSALQGLDIVSLSATLAADGTPSRRNGEIRLIETTGSATTSYGALRFSGDLTLTAGQVYATTLSSFTLDGCNGCGSLSALTGNSHLTLLTPDGGSTSTAPLSALGSLTAIAGTIEHDGVIRQPFGSVKLAANTLDIGEHSITSVSGDGLVVPVGSTVNGQDWIYYEKLGTSTTLNGLPVAKEVVFNGKNLSIDAAAKVDASAGGDLQAWEFVAGVGGSTDYLANSGLYAVIPSYGYDFAPYDTDVAMRNGQKTAGDLYSGMQIEITMAGSALAPGRYTLLPARYALLPGAVLVSVASGQGTPLKTALQQNDGSTIVTGSFTGTGSNAGSDAGTRILVQPPATYLARSQQDRTSIGGLLSDRASSLGQDRPALPFDGGRFSLVAQKLDWSGAASFDLAGKDDALAGQLDISITGGKIAIVDDPSQTLAGYGTAQGWTLLSAAGLSASNAGSVLIGGVRSGTDTLTLDVQAAQVSLQATGTELSAAEVILAGTDEVSLASGSKLTAKGDSRTGNRTLHTSGDSALAMVSTSADTVVARSDVTGDTGKLTVASGATLGGPAAYLNATGSFALSDQAQIKTDTLGLAATKLSIGEAPAGAGGTVLSGDLLKAVQKVNSLQLSGVRGIDFYGSQTLNVSRLTLDAPVLRGLGQAGDVVKLQARQVTLRNSSNGGELKNGSGQTVTAANMGSPLKGVSQLQIQTTPDLSDQHVGGLTLGPGRMALGFSDATLQTTGDVTFTGTGMLVAQKNLTVKAARVTAATGADNGVDASTGLLRIDRSANAHTLGERVGQGARLSFEGQRIEQAGWIDAASGRVAFQAGGAAGRSDSIVFEKGSVTSAAGFDQKVTDSYAVQGDAGRITATAGSGDVVLDGKLDVSGVGQANAGSIALNAAAGRLDVGADAQLAGASAGSGALSGSFGLDAATLAMAGQDTTRLDGLAALLRNGGFGNEVDLRVRQGDLELGAGATLKSQRVIIAADGGRLTVAGSIDATASTGGVVQLFADADLALLDGASIKANSTRSAANGGDVLLSTTNGQLRLGQGITIDASGDDAQDGRIVLRAARAGSGVNVAAFDSSLLKAAEIGIAGVQRYTGYSSLVAGNGGGTSLGRDTLTSDNQDFMGNASTILGDLGVTGDLRVHLRPEVEIVASSNFTIDGDWDLGVQDHYDGSRAGLESGFLTVRAAGDLLVKGSISDGFEGTGRAESGSTPTAILPGDGWSLRLVAGADTGASNLLATRGDGSGDLSIASNQIVRTTSGSIELAAGGDIRLEKDSEYDTQAVVYVAGRLSDTHSALASSTGLDTRWAWTPQFTSHGGRLELAAGNDIVGQPSTQLFGSWFYHTGEDDSSPTAWWTAFDAFRQGVGSFGGGNVRVTAGRDVRNLGVVSPTSAIATSTDTGTARMSVENGGDVVVDAGNDITGGMYFLGRGTGVLRAGRDIVKGDATQTADGYAIDALPSMLGLMDGRWTVLAGRDLLLGSVFNPTFMPGSTVRNGGMDDGRLFFTYGTDSGLVARTTAGNLEWNAAALNDGTIFPFVNTYGDETVSGGVGSASNVLYVAANLTLQALDGKLVLAGSPTLLPSATGQIDLYAGGDASLQGLLMADQATSRWASVTNTFDYIDSDAGSTDGELGRFLLAQGGNPASQYLDLPPGGTELVGRFQGIHAGDPNAAQIHAGGSIEFGNKSLVLPKAAEITAGLDIRNLNYTGQHLGSDDVTLLKAGRNFLGLSSAGSETGGLITLIGPGSLVVDAGRQIDMGKSQGFNLSANQLNASLPAQGARLTMSAGTSGTLDVDTFAQRYLSFGPGQDATLVQQRRDALVIAVREALGLEPLSGPALSAAYDDSLAAFRKLTPEHQAAFAREQLARAFAATYLAGGQPYAGVWQRAALAAHVSDDLSDPDNYRDPRFRKVFDRVRDQAMMDELERVGMAVSGTADRAKRDALFAQGFKAIDLAARGDSFDFQGDMNLTASKINSWGGDVKIMAPGGRINVGLPAITEKSASSDYGIVAYGADVQAMARGDFQVASQKVFSVGNLNDVMVWSSFGNIDNGRGSNTAVAAPALRQVRAADGTVRYESAPVTTGSGIAVLQDDKDVCDKMGTCNVTLTAVYGEILALDTLIRAGGRVSLAAQVVKGADNIVGGSVVGAPVTVSAAGMAISSPPPSDPSKNKKDDAVAGSTTEQSRKSQLTVELIGLGMEPTGAGPADRSCLPGESDEDCRLRGRKSAD
jgi:filamentous hemagglutinin